MVIRWQIIFKDIDEKKHYVDIYDATKDTATVDILTGAANPVSTDEQSDDDFYMPIRTQSGYLRFVIDKQHEDILSELMPTTATDRPVVLRDDSGRTEWVGFLTGEQYSQPWKSIPYTVELPIQDVMATMKGVNFIQNDGYTSIKSLFDLISSYLPVNALDYSFPDSVDVQTEVVNYNFQEYMTEQERKDHNTEDVYDTITVQEAMEYFCKYFGMSCRQYGNHIVLACHDGTGYISKGDQDYKSPATHNLSDLKLRGASNKKSFSKAYGVVIGEFDVGTSKSEDAVFSLPTDFSNIFTIHSVGHWRVIYNDNSDYQCYVDGQRGVDADFAFGPSKNKSYGLIVSLPGGSVADNGLNREWKNGFVFRSTKGAEQCTAIKMTAHKSFYFEAKTGSLLSINAEVEKLMGGSFGSGEFGSVSTSGVDDPPQIKALYLKIRIGKYWLKYTTETTKNKAGIEQTTHKVEWVETECVSRFPLSDAKIEFWTDVTTELPYYSSDRLMEDYVKLSGLCVNIPEGLRGTFADMEIEFVANAYTNDEYVFEGKNYLQYILTSFSAGIYYEADTENQLAADKDQNKYIIPLGNAYTSKYQVSSTITTRRGMQHGTGLLLDSSHAYVTRQYDLEGLQRRAKILGKCREILTVVVDGVLPCTDTVTWHGKNYIILSQSVQWRDCETTLKLLNVD